MDLKHQRKKTEFILLTEPCFWDFLKYSILNIQ